MKAIANGALDISDPGAIADGDDPGLETFKPSSQPRVGCEPQGDDDVLGFDMALLFF